MFILLLSSSTRAAPSQAIDLGQAQTSVEFLAIGKPSLLKIKGSGGKILGQVKLENGQITGRLNVSLDSISTGISLRDQHMKEKYLETGKFPEAVLEITELSLDPNFLVVGDAKKAEVPFKGKLILHGTEKLITGSSKIESLKDSLSVRANFKTSISEFNIAVPSYLGIKVADEVEITADIKIKK